VLAVLQVLVQVQEVSMVQTRCLAQKHLPEVEVAVGRYLAQINQRVVPVVLAVEAREREEAQTLPLAQRILAVEVAGVAILVRHALLLLVVPAS
jgi:hypothetical protein